MYRYFVQNIDEDDDIILVGRYWYSANSFQLFNSDIPVKHHAL